MRRFIDLKIFGYLVLQDNDSLSFGVISEQILDCLKTTDVFFFDVPSVRVVLYAVHAALNYQEMLQKLHLLGRLLVFWRQLH